MPDELLLKLCLHAKQLHLLPLLVPQIPAAQFLPMIHEILNILKDEYADPCPVMEQILQNTDKNYQTAFRNRIADIAMQNGHQDMMIYMLKSLEKADRLKLATYLMTNFPGSKKQPGSDNFQVPLINQLKVITLLTREMASDFAQSPATLNNILYVLFTAKNSTVLREVLVNLPRATINAALKQPHNLLQLAADPKLHRIYYILFKHYGTHELDTSHAKIVEKFEASLPENQMKELSAELTNEKNYQTFHGLLYKLIQGGSIKEIDIQNLFKKIDMSPESDHLLCICFFEIINTLNWIYELKRPNINYQAILALANAFLQENKKNRLNFFPQAYYDLACIAFATGDVKRACNYFQWVDYILCYTKEPSSFHYVRPRINKLILLMLQAFKIPISDEMRQFYLHNWRTASEMPIVLNYLL